MIKGIGESLDRKYYISAQSREHNTMHDERDSILFLAKDKALVPMLEFYYDRLKELGADENQLTAVVLLIGRVRTWQETYPEEVKVPDIELPQGVHLTYPNLVPPPVEPVDMPLSPTTPGESADMAFDPNTGIEDPAVPGPNAEPDSSPSPA